MREQRLALKLSLTEVAKELQLAKSTLSSYEAGRRTMDAFTLADLCLIYGVSTDYAMYGTHMVPADLRDLFARIGASGRADHNGQL